MTLTHDFDDGTGARMREVDPPPSPPREEMWASIEFARRYAGPRRRSGLSFVQAGLGLAATLALGISIGRLAREAPDPVTLPDAPVATAPASEAGPESPAFYQLVTEEHMAEAEILLAGLDEATPERPHDVAAWARSLLMDTRLLIESPAAGDAERARLLLDLELVLAQIASLPPADPAPEIELIRDGIRRTNVLARLRSATDALAAAGM